MNSLGRKGDWIQTYKQRQFWPLDPRSEDIDIEDIAHSLSLICRFGGHCNEFYSVAQHSVLVSTMVRESESLVGLLHDGTEAYIGDVVRPLKKDLPNFQEIERHIERIIFDHFGITYYDKEEIKRADNIALFTEMRDLMNEPPKIWKQIGEYLPLLLDKKITPINSKESERLFLKRYEELRNQ